jgi:hypothetical protein
MHRFGRTLFASASLLALAATTAHAQSDLEKLSAFQSTGAADFTFIEQGGSKAEAIKRTLEKISLPDGFSIGLYAIVPDARHMAVGPQGIVTFVGTRKTEVWSVTDRDKDRVADEVKNFAPSLAKAIPNGPCFSPDGHLYIAEQNRVVWYPAAEFFYESPDVAAFNGGQAGRADPAGRKKATTTPPASATSGRTASSTSRIGQPFNVPAPEKADLYKKWGHWRHHPHEHGWNRPRSLCDLRHSQFCRSRLSIRRPATSGSPTTRSTAWATISPRVKSTMQTAAGQNFRLPVVRWRSYVRTNEYQNERAARGCRVPGRRARSLMPPTSA